jgi:uncharacterized membrane protein YfcA
VEYLSSTETALLLLVVGTLAGFVDSIAGGGGLLTVPALLWAGLPPALALGTNKLQGSFGTLAATWSFWRRRLVDPREMLPAIAWTLLGAVLGTTLVQHLDPGFLERLVPLLLIGFALYFLYSPRVADLDAQARLGRSAFALLIGTSVGFYDGFFGPGTGAFFALAHVALLGYNLRRATAHTKVLNFTSNLASLTAFAIGGNLVWAVGLLMALGQFGGAWVGSRLVVRHGTRLVRPLLVAVSLAISAKLLLAP